MKNAHRFMTSQIPSLQSMFSYSTNSRSSRSMPLLNIERHQSETFKKSVHYRTVTSWNDLPKDIQFEQEFQSENKLCAFKQCIFDVLVKAREREFTN